MPLARDEFIAALRHEFPEVAVAIDPDVEAGLLHLEVAALARAAQVAIDSRNEEEVCRHFAFLDDLFRDAGPELKNALYVSYLENLNFMGDREYAQQLLTPRLHAAWLEISGYLDNLFAASKQRR